MRNGNLLKSRVSEIRVKRIHVHQGVGVLLAEFQTFDSFLNKTLKTAQKDCLYSKEFLLFSNLCM